MTAVQSDSKDGDTLPENIQEYSGDIWTSTDVKERNPPVPACPPYKNGERE